MPESSQSRAGSASTFQSTSSTIGSQPLGKLGLWRVNGGTLQRIPTERVPSEAELANWIESYPILLGEPLLLIGREVRTPHGRIDLLAINGEGITYIIEIKKDQTPASVLAQTLDYASWVLTLVQADIERIYTNYNPNETLGAAFERKFGGSLAEYDVELNIDQRLLIVAASLDAKTERAVAYLREKYQVPVRAVFFQHFGGDGESFVAASGLADLSTVPYPSESEGWGSPCDSKSNDEREAVEGSNWYVNFGNHPNGDGRSWEDGFKYGFVSGGGADWYSRTLRRIPAGAKIFCYVPKHGYVGIGNTTGDPELFSSLCSRLGISKEMLNGTYPDGDTAESAEYAIPVKWVVKRPVDEAFYQPGLFANTNTAVVLTDKQKHQETIAAVASALLGE